VRLAGNENGRATQPPHRRAFCFESSGTKSRTSLRSKVRFAPYFHLHLSIILPSQRFQLVVCLPLIAVDDPRASSSSSFLLDESPIILAIREQLTRAPSSFFISRQLPGRAIRRTHECWLGAAHTSRDQYRWKMHPFSGRSLLALAATALFTITPTVAQTTTKCNPLTQSKWHLSAILDIHKTDAHASMSIRSSTGHLIDSRFHQGHPPSLHLSRQPDDE
jgi:hypothetical protein